MLLVILTAFGVGGATMLGSVIGMLFKNISRKFSDIILSFAAGVMLASSVWGLIIPSVEHGGKYGIVTAVVGIFAGAVFLDLIDKSVSRVHKFIVPNAQNGNVNEKLDKVLLFVLAIAIHNLPEGVAAGVGFGTGNVAEALLIAGGIALQNIPEGMIIIEPMLSAGIPPKKTFLIAVGTGVVEIVGAFLGYFAVSTLSAVLPFALAFAGGTMLYVTADEIIPETHMHGNEKHAVYSLLTGFCATFISDTLLN